jgi:CHAT domain-containing protein
VQALGLRKVELAVLSACETGLGKVAGGEDVFGLQRAFQVAGAHTTVTSLWSVDDKATQQLMVRFYENRWEKKLPALEALTEAQRWLLTEGVKRGMVRLRDKDEAKGAARTPPYFWAAFVLSGDWR